MYMQAFEAFYGAQLRASETEIRQIEFDLNESLKEDANLRIDKVGVGLLPDSLMLMLHCISHSCYQFHKWSLAEHDTV